MFQTLSSFDYTMKKKKQYNVTGYVLGYLWGGGEGAYPSKEFKVNTKKDILIKLRDGIENGSLDSGMGYESLIGGIFDIERITTVKIDGDDYTHSDYEQVFYGKLSKKQKSFLEKVLYGE